MVFRRRLVTLAAGLLLVASMSAPPVSARPATAPPAAPPVANQDGDGVLQVPDALTGAGGDSAKKSTLEKIRGGAVLDPVQALLGNGPSGAGGTQKGTGATAPGTAGKAGSDKPFGTHPDALTGASATSAAAGASTNAGGASTPSSTQNVTIQQNPAHPQLTPRLAAAALDEAASSMRAASERLLRARLLGSAKTAATVSPSATYTISGRFTAPGGAGVANVQVGTFDLPGYALTDAAGSYSLAVPEGAHSLWFTPADTYAGGYYSSTSPTGVIYDWNAATPVTVGGNVTVNVQLEPFKRITGSVTTVGGTPIEGIRVHALPDETGYSQAYAYTAADGTYSLNVATGTYRIEFADLSGVYLNAYFVAAGQPAGPYSTATPVVVGTANVPGISVRLQVALKITGTVRTTTGTPIPNITVVAIGTDGLTYAGTAADGTYQLLLGPGTYVLEFNDWSGGVYVSGYYSSTGWVSDAGAATPITLTNANVPAIDIRLPRYLQLSGRVVAAGSTTGLPNVWVSAEEISSGRGDSTTTDGTGAYVLSLAPGTYVLRIEDQSGDYAGGYFAGGAVVADGLLATPVTITSDRSGLNVKLALLPHISGKVTATGAMHPVLIAVEGSEYPHSKLSAADGTYSIGVEPGLYRVRVSDVLGTYSGGYYAASGFTAKRADATIVIVTTANVTGKNIKLPAALHLKGKVTGPSGAALGGVNVAAMADAQYTATTAADGTYSIAVPIGAYRISYSPPAATGLIGGVYAAPGLTIDSADAATVIAATGDVSGLDVKLLQGHRIGGRVGGASDASSGDVLALSGRYSVSVTPAADGTYSLVVPSGTYTLSASYPEAGNSPVYYAATGSTLDLIRSDALTVASSDVSGIDFTRPATHILRGTIASSAGAPISGATVWVSSVGHGGGMRTTTGADGSFALTLLSDDYTLQVEATDAGNTTWRYAHGSLVQASNGSPITVGAADVSIGALRLPQLHLLSGKITTASGGAPGRASVTALALDGSFSSMAHTDGTFSVPVPSGTYVLLVQTNEGRGYYAGPGTLTDAPEAAALYTVGSTNVTGVSVRLPGGITLSGRVTDAAGAPLPGVQVRTSAYALHATSITGADGTYRLEMLAGAPTAVYFGEEIAEYSSGYYGATGLVFGAQDAVAVPTTTSRSGIDVRLPLNRHIAGTVTTAAGKPAPGELVLASSDTYTGNDTTAYDGTYRIGIPNGTYLVSVGSSITDSTEYRAASGVTFDVNDASRTSVSGADAGGVNIALPQIVKLTGRLTRAGARGIPGANVVAFSTTVQTMTTTDPDGSYTLRVPAGRYGIEFADGSGTYGKAFYSTGGPVASQAQASPIVITTAARSGVNLQLAAARHVSGKITAGGKPLAGYEVDLFSTGLPGYGYSTTTHGDGTYSVAVPAGTYSVFVGPSYGAPPNGTYLGGYITPAGSTAYGGDPRLITVGAADVGGVNAAVPASPTISGKVKTPSGTAAILAVVWVESEMFGVTARAGLDGSYSVAVPAGSYTAQYTDFFGRYYSGFYSTSGLTPLAANATAFAVGAAGASGIDATFVPGPSITGKVTTNAYVGVLVATSADGYAGQATVYDGEYSIPVPPGTYTLAFEFQSWEYATTTLSGYYTASGLVTSRNDATAVAVGASSVHLPTVPAHDGRVVSGHIVGANGLPLLSAEASALGSKAGYADTAYANALGAYAIPVPADSYVLSFTDGEYGYASGYLGADATTRYTADYAAASRLPVAAADVRGVTVTLPAARHIRGTVTSPSGARVSGIGVQAVLPSGYTTLFSGVDTAADGTYSLPVGPGAYTVHFLDASRVNANGWYSTTGFKLAKTSASPVTVADRDVTGIDVKLTRGPGGATFVSLTPNRLVDTRSKLGLSAKLSANRHATFQVTGRAPADAARNVPATAVAVTGNLTVVNQTAAGFVALTPVANDAPATSTLNFPLGDIRANAVTVPLGAGGKLSVTYVARAGNTADAVFDVTGYFMPGTAGATYTAVTPNRLVDSRSKLGVAAKLSAGKHATFHVTDRVAGDRDRNIPPTAIAVTGNLTVVGQTAKGFLSLTPEASDAPTTSTLNFPVGDIRANAVTVPIKGDGTLSVTYVAPAGATADVVFDVSGYFEPGAAGAVYVPLTPSRLVDSRIDVGLTAALTANKPATFHTADRAPGVAAKNVPANAVGVTGNLTVVYPTARGFLALTATPQAAPATSTLNFPVRDVRANAVTATLGAGGTLNVTYAAAAGARADIVFDVTGCFVN